MQSQLFKLFVRLEALSLREQMLIVLGIPAMMLLVAEMLVFGPARTRAAEARQLVVVKQAELKALSATLAALPSTGQLPAADQLRKQRSGLQAQIDEADRVMADAARTVDWGTVVRASVAGTPGLTLTQLKTQPADVIFSPAMLKIATANATKPGAPASAASASAAPTVLDDFTVYRHKAELTVQGEFGALMGYVQSLQQVSGDLRWERAQIAVANFPQASIQLTLYTLSTRPETPFN